VIQTHNLEVTQTLAVDLWLADECCRNPASLREREVLLTHISDFARVGRGPYGPTRRCGPRHHAHYRDN